DTAILQGILRIPAEMVGLSCSNIELKDAGWNTFLRKNECNLLIYNVEYQMVESSSRYQSGQFYGVVRFFCLPE
ncbi:hypothetical protein, partial [Alistipes shahii]|uniref:hypothetical protein n=1 Tax=Alistipes shahii TaxID=328814 RepID=UPI00266FFB61